MVFQVQGSSRASSFAFDRPETMRSSTSVEMVRNLTPRKCLGFLTPVQALLGELGRDVRIRFA